MIFSNLPDMPLLGVNIDHVATLRNARGGEFPDPVAAALLAVEAGADIITFHLREDRRHIRDDDVRRLKEALKVPLNFEAAVNDDVLGIIESTRPEHVCLVPERRLEVTTEGGLDVAGQLPRIREACRRLADIGCRVSLFISADPAQIEASAEAGAPCIELHTGAYANAWWAGSDGLIQAELAKVRQGLQRGRSLGLQTNAGHGLALSSSLPGSFQGLFGGSTQETLFDSRSDSRSDSRPDSSGALDRPYSVATRQSSTAAIAALTEVAELHIGHALIGHAVFVGLRQAVADFRAEIVRARVGSRAR